MTKQHNNENPLSPEYWEALGIKPVVVNTSNEEDINNKSAEVAERIKDAVEELKKEQQDG